MPLTVITKYDQLRYDYKVQVFNMLLGLLISAILVISQTTPSEDAPIGLFSMAFGVVNIIGISSQWYTYQNNRNWRKLSVAWTGATAASVIAIVVFTFSNLDKLVAAYGLLALFCISSYFMLCAIKSTMNKIN